MNEEGSKVIKDSKPIKEDSNESINWEAVMVWKGIIFAEY